jgi:hypothetical protein
VVDMLAGCSWTCGVVSKVGCSAPSVIVGGLSGWVVDLVLIGGLSGAFVWVETLAGLSLWHYQVCLQA